MREVGKVGAPKVAGSRVVEFRPKVERSRPLDSSYCRSPANAQRGFPTGKLIAGGVLAVGTLVATFASSYTVEPGTVGVLVRMGTVDKEPITPGWGVKKLPFVTSIYSISTKQTTEPSDAECVSSNLQQVSVHLKILYSIPNSSAVEMHTKYSGDPFKTLVEPRVQEALKEATAAKTAEDIVKDREDIKKKTLDGAKAKMEKNTAGEPLIIIEDVVIANVDLSENLKHAIEQKMIQEQAALQSKFSQDQKRTEADTAVIQAEGEAKSTTARARAEAENTTIRAEAEGKALTIKAKANADAIKIQSDALAGNPAFIQYEIAHNWNGVGPTIFAGGGQQSGFNILLPAAQPPPSEPKKDADKK